MPDCKDKRTGNCTVARDPDDDLPVQCVGPWVRDKHYYLRRFVDATRYVRAKFNPPGPGPRGGTAFVDLFAGPGRARIAKPTEFVDGSPLVAIRAAGEEQPFTKVVLCDIVEENVNALRARTDGCLSHVEFVHGDCNRDIEAIAAHIPPHAFTLVLVDPFGPSALHFETIRRLASFSHLDFIIHWPVGSMKRRFLEHETFEAVLGIPRDKWGVEINFGSDIPKLLPVYRRQLESLGYIGRMMNAPAIKNTRNVTLYHLVFASKDERGEQIWNNVTKKLPDGQTTFELK